MHEIIMQNGSLATAD